MSVYTTIPIDFSQQQLARAIPSTFYLMQLDRPGDSLGDILAFDIR